jgi:putative FmdB family regulatory protein
MPLYEYECESCGSRFERIRKFSDPPVDTCIKCGKGPVRKLISSPAIQFKGSGWYITDYAKKSSTDAGTTGSSAAEKADKAAEKADRASKTEKSDAGSKSDTSSSSTSDASTSKSTKTE